MATMVYLPQQQTDEYLAGGRPNSAIHHPYLAQAPPQKNFYYRPPSQDGSIPRTASLQSRRGPPSLRSNPSEHSNNEQHYQSQPQQVQQRGYSAPPKIRPGITPAVQNYRWLLTQPAVEADTLESIRAKARATWLSGTPSGPTTFETTSYTEHYPEKVLDEPTPLRPTSPTRLNNPHPPMMFLTCRLHHVPGFTNPDAVIGKPAYAVDASMGGEMRFARERLRDKYKARPQTAAVTQYRSNPIFDEFVTTRYTPDPEAKHNKNDYDMQQILADIQNEDEERRKEIARKYDQYKTEGSAPTASLHRYLKYAGPIETNRLKSSGPQQRPPSRDKRPVSMVRPKTAAPSFGGSTSDGMSVVSAGSGAPNLRTEGIRRQSSLIYQTKPGSRGNYLIHSQWPTTINHHSVP